MRKKKQILVNEAELRQQQARASPVAPSLFQRFVGSVRRGGSSGAHATAQLIATLKEEVSRLCLPNASSTACCMQSTQAIMPMHSCFYFISTGNHCVLHSKHPSHYAVTQVLLFHFDWNIPFRCKGWRAWRACSAWM